MGRTQFHPENRAAVIARLEVGMSLAAAAEGADINAATVRGWVARGRREREGEYADFAAAVAAARSTPKIEPLTEAEHRAKVSEVARGGNVQALKLYWEMILADRKSDEAPQESTDPLADVDELAERRSART